MKKLFISCPMRGRTDEDIKKSMEKMHKIAEIIFDQELKVIDSFIEGNAPKNTNEGIYYLGKSIEKLAKADYFIGIDFYEDFWRGCMIENDIARKYGVPSTHVNIHEIMPDAEAVINKWYKEQKKTYKAALTPKEF